MVTDGRVHDIDKDDTDRWCEYIFYRGVERTAYARISRGSVTDTELQVGQFAIPSHVGTTTGEGDVPEADRYLRGFKEDFPKEHVCPFFYFHHALRSCSFFGRHSPSSGFLMHTLAMRISVECGATITTSSTRWVPDELLHKLSQS
jgi:hypothetical protein